LVPWFLVLRNIILGFWILRSTCTTHRSKSGAFSAGRRIFSPWCVSELGHEQSRTPRRPATAPCHI
jgi:hypothetical protein